MNFCFQNTTLQADRIIEHNPKCQQGFDILQETDEFRQNLHTIKIPTSIVRSSSLAKITHTCQQISRSSSKQHHSKNLPNNNQISNNINTHQTNKIKPYLNSKSAIVNKLLKKNHSKNQPASAIKNKQNHKQTSRTELPIELFYHKHQNLNKMIKLYKEKSQKELKECTFNPKTNVQTSARNHHQNKEFYMGQIQHCKRTQDKVEQLRLLIKAEKQKQNTFRPKISQQTRQLTQRRANANVYDRLYKESKEKCNQAENQGNVNEYYLKRPFSKNSISLVSSTKKSRQYESQEKNDKASSIKHYMNERQMRSKELRKQNSVKTFSQMLQKKGETTLNLLQKSNNVLSSKKNGLASKKQSVQSSQKKIHRQNMGSQLLDCRQLIKQKQQQSNNLLSREQSCKLMPSISKDWIQKESSRLLHKNDSHSVRGKTNQKNQKIALQKFTKQFFTVVQKLGLTRVINFNQFLTFMTNMNFVENLQDFYEAKTETQLKIKLFEIWSMLEGEQQGYILLMNLFKIICAIQGYSNYQMVQEVLKSVIKYFNMIQFNQINQGKTLVLSQKDSKAIKKDYMNFHFTRFKLGQSKLYARESSGNFYSFRPSVSEESKEFAQKYRQRIITESQKLITQGAIHFTVPQNGIIDHSTLLILDQKIKNYKIQQMRLETQKEKRKKQDESMVRPSSYQKSVNQTTLTYRDKNATKNEELNSNVFSRISHNQSCSRSKDQIFTELYEQGRKSRSNRRDKSADEIQFEETMQELTFKPKINKVGSMKQFNQQINLHDNIPNFTKQVMRMRKNKNQTRNNLSVSPLLYLNVTMQGNSQAKIPVYQTDNIHTITQKVRVMMKIQNGQEERQKLKDILKNQIIPILDQLHINIKQENERFMSERQANF